MKPLGLYLHIPFCPYRCQYCDFLVLTGREEAIPRYVQVLAADLKQYATVHPGYEIQSIFIGGGTPSLLEAEQIEVLLLAVQENFSTPPEMEITLEANPDTLSSGKLQGYRRAGVNRLSLGVQSLQRQHLTRAGRGHTPEGAADAFALARQAGFRNISVDLMFGFPDQTLPQWRKTLEEVIQWNPEHVSMYGLQLEPGTPFEKAFKAGSLRVPSDNTQAEMYETGIRMLSEHGFIHYEISNLAKPDYAGRHNQIYWNNGEYLGLGIGAVSYINKERFRMTRNLSQYLSGRARVIDREALSLKGEMGETVE